MHRCIVGIMNGKLDRKPVGRIIDNGEMMVRENLLMK